MGRDLAGRNFPLALPTTCYPYFSFICNRTSGGQKLFGERGTSDGLNRGFHNTITGETEMTDSARGGMWVHKVIVTLGSLQKLRNIDNVFRGRLPTTRRFICSSFGYYWTQKFRGHIFIIIGLRYFISHILRIFLEEGGIFWSLLASFLFPVKFWPLLASIESVFLLTLFWEPFNSRYSKVPFLSGETFLI